MRVELPEGYVPPDPTHPLYGYLTPDELAAYEADERARLGIVPGVVEPAMTEVESQPMTVVWAPPSLGGGENGPETGPISPPLVSEAPVTEAEEATVAHTGWVPAPPPEPEAVEPTMGGYVWDAYKQEWVLAAPRPPDAAEEPPPDVAAAAGGRGASSSWTSADGQRFRWDARGQRWITEAAEGSG
jgi:hypothetical protein